MEMDSEVFFCIRFWGWQTLHQFHICWWNWNKR